ncbi:ATP-grasp domain-containing protein [Streptomyces cocklensis]|uniref:Biotin carboxylase / Biotin carboxyl carrier protein n=1 Tax=Actinacidiphila cocklensis TaxID=887465 RepID=A0A9W4GV23_9ACTN|nr:biotin carboxylase N-terminal domain-containing protein [Actinacidiphila cocklensis]MDD1061760.1 ATP-grasp domain-containing protein [Actinacidiphila cocklensis]CAG6396277.1 Biotin carboxylase / Biotin carboxyl carrier protein [Actinacidiphila cocklensis]
MGTPIGSVLVANRGEIARRVFRTCRALGIATVAVYSDADGAAAHVAEADAAVRLPGDAPADTYLRADLLVAAALSAGADAVHPGYGFLSESAGFARAVTAAGLVWIGPPAAAVEAMGSKTRAKELMAAAGVPVFAALDPGAVTDAQLPLLVKAAAGGGGRGMRVVRERESLEGELAAARAEAAAAFGDGEVFVEPYVEGARHVEVQLLADDHGTVWVLGERDCSLQRRHQKVIEETPAPGLAAQLRAELHRAAVSAARSIGYRGAGTAEFLVSADGRPYFLEMNTRLQVEHPVTECVTGLDLVAWQIRIAEGAALPPEPPAPRGHAVEARLCAEDPARGWQPQPGDLHLLDIPGVDAEFAVPPGRDAGLRLDSGVTGGERIGVHYDPMLAKLIAWAPTRAEAVRRLAHALERSRLHGPVTNRDLLVRALRHPDFGAARLDTGFFERHAADLGLAQAGAGEPDGARVDAERFAALAAALADAAGRTGAPGAAVPVRLGGWRNVPSQPQLKRFRAEPDGRAYDIRYRLDRDGLAAEGFDGVRLVSAAADRVVLEAGGVLRTYLVAARPERTFVDSPFGSAALTALPRFPDPEQSAAPGSLRAPMPGTVVRTAGLAAGDRVEAGQPLLWLEAMKMEHVIAAPAAGTLLELTAEVGRQVELGAVLAVVKEEREGTAP